MRDNRDVNCGERHLKRLAPLLPKHPGNSWLSNNHFLRCRHTPETMAGSSSAYTAALKALYSANLFLRVKQGLRNTQQLLHELGNPQGRVPVVHVVGTNGKGSVCWKLASALQAAGLRTGLFSSPHISSFRERIRCNKELISQAQVVHGLGRVEEAAHMAGVPATYFERVTALALCHFAQEDMDVIVLEAGLGGRLDSTNVVPSPLACVLTTVGMDHTTVLGTTAEAIAWEKAGIAKRGSPLIAGPCSPQAMVGVLARQRGGTLVPVPPAWWAAEQIERLGSATASEAATWPARVVPIADLREEYLPVQPPLPPGNNFRARQLAELVDYDDDNTQIALSTLHAVAGYDTRLERADLGGLTGRTSEWHCKARTVARAIAACSLPSLIMPATLGSQPPCNEHPVLAALRRRPPCRMDAVAVPPAVAGKIMSSLLTQDQARGGQALPEQLETLCSQSATHLLSASTASSGTPLSFEDHPKEATPASAVVVFDAAHNPEGMAAFWASLARRLSGAATEQGRGAPFDDLRARYSVAVVMACSSDRDPCAMVRPALHATRDARRLFFAESDALKAQSPAVLAAAALVEQCIAGLVPTAVVSRIESSLGVSVADLRSRVWAEDSALSLLGAAALTDGGSSLDGQWFRLQRSEEEVAAEAARADRVASAAADRARAGLAAGARLTLHAERDEEWKRREVDSASGVGVRYARLEAVEGVACGKGTTAVAAHRSAIHRAFQAALRHCVGVAVPGQLPLLVVCGSVYAMREAREALGIVEPRDTVVK